MLPLAVVRTMVVAAVVFLVFIWLFAAFDRTPEDRRQDDEDQMEWMREYENNRKASRWTGQKRKRDT